MDARTPLQPAVVTPKQALSIKPFGLDMDVLLTTEATGGATSVIVAWHKPGVVSRIFRTLGWLSGARPWLTR